MSVRSAKCLLPVVIGLALTLLLAASVPAHATDPLARAVAWLHTQQLPDGSFGLREPGGAGVGSASATADAVTVLALLGEDPDGPAWTAGGRSALDALAALAPSYVAGDAGQAGKVARAVALAGGDPRAFNGLDLVETIKAAYDPATGRYHPELLYRHTLALEGLLRAGEPAPAAAVDALLAARHADGSWFWAFEGAGGDVDSTGRTLQLLGSLQGLRCAPLLAPAGDYLAARREAGGWSVGYLPGPANANSTALAVAGLAAAGYDPAAGRFSWGGSTAVEALLAFQEPGGAFVYALEPGHEESRLMATLDALAALVQIKTGPAPCRPFYLPMLLARRV